MADKAPVLTNDAVYIAQSMLEYFNTWPKKPCEFKLEVLPKEGPSLMVQQMAGAYKARPFVDGSYVGLWPFAIYYRTAAPPEDTASRIKALEIIQEFFDWVSKQDLTTSLVLGGGKIAQRIDMTSIPSKVVEYEDGSEDYQSTFEFEYKQRRNY